MPLSLRTWTTDRGDSGQRLDLVLRRRLGDVHAATRTRVQSWIAEGRVSVNGVTVCKVAARTGIGDFVRISLPEGAVPLPMQAEAIDLDLLYEDDDLLVINKPAGRVVHPTYRHQDGTLMNALLWHARHWPAGRRPSLVGRLDKMTSGLLVVAKTRAVHAALQQAMQSSDSAKDYLAVVYGRVGAGRGDIALNLGRDPSDRRRVVASDAGRSSLTRYERIATTPGPDALMSLLCCRLVTGRMHQIRVHLAAKGWPIVGDAKYGEPRWQGFADRRLADIVKSFPRQALHAWRLGVRHPATNARLQIDAPIPEDLRALLVATGLPRPVP